MVAFCKKAQPPQKYSGIQLYADLLQYTMQKCKSLLPVMNALLNHNIVYHWVYPTNLYL